MRRYLTYVILAAGMLAIIGLTIGSVWTIGSLLLTVSLMGALVYLAFKTEGSRMELNDLKRLRAAYHELDQQAKLIVRTDLELHRTQEELDHRLASLVSLHQLGRKIQVSLHPGEIFDQLDPMTARNFGFSKALLGLCPSEEQIEWRSMIGMARGSAESLAAHVVQSGLLSRLMGSPAPLTLQVGTVTNPAHQRLLELLGAQEAVLVGILPHAGPKGCLVVGREASSPSSALKANEEFLFILAKQLAIAVENSELYEKTWTSQQELERKVQQRTRELAEANAELIRLNKAKSDFVSAVSHELRTPLTAIRGYASLLGREQFGPLTPPQAERLVKIERHVDLLAHLITDLLDIARLESGRITMERRAILVKEFIATIHDAVHPQLEAKRIRYEEELDGVTELLGDAQHLRRVFINLLSNAIKYTPEGGTIRLGLQRHDNTVLASVSDTGCGIAPEELPKLFQEFYRANDPINQQIRGTGLGLVLVKRIVESHQGRIWVTSEPGKGSTFSVSLPAT